MLLLTEDVVDIDDRRSTSPLCKRKKSQVGFIGINWYESKALIIDDERNPGHWNSDFTM